MAITPIDANSFSLYSPYDISGDEALIINNANNFAVPEEGTPSVGGLEATATSVAINPIPLESIELRELQDNVLSSYDELRASNTSNEILENENTFTEEQNNKALLDLTSSFIDTVENSGNSESNLSDYASLFDKINAETQTPGVSEQLQAYTQNLKY